VLQAQLKEAVDELEERCKGEPCCAQLTRVPVRTARPLCSQS
jgi:hypothetical protein